MALENSQDLRKRKRNVTVTAVETVINSNDALAIANNFMTIVSVGVDGMDIAVQMVRQFL